MMKALCESFVTFDKDFREKIVTGQKTANARHLPKKKPYVLNIHEEISSIIS